MLEKRVQRHAEPAHHGLRGLVEHGGHGPDLGQARATEGHAERGGAGLGGVSVVPRVPGQSPAHLHAPRAGDAGGHRVQPGKPKEPAGRGVLQGPQPEPLPLEQRLHPVDVLIAGRAVEGSREIAHDLGVGVHRGERPAVRIAPAPHQQAFGAEVVEPGHHPGSVASPG
jgi:hypothetical protein